MSKSVNRVFLLGTLARDPESKPVDSDTPADEDADAVPF